MPEWLPQPETDEGGEPFCRFVARQPILDRNRRTFGYELLFRTGWENRFCADGEAASRHMIDNAVAFGMESLVGEAVPFVNCTRDLLVKGLPTLLPAYTVLEVLEDVEVDEDLVAACKRLCGMGYALALDDYDFSGRWEPLLGCASYIKVDFRCTTTQQRRALIHRLRYSKVRFVAEKIEDEAEFKMAMEEGFDFFQGYFFKRPVVLGRPALTTVIHRFRFLSELSKPGFNQTELLRLLKEEPTISYRLLRLANSATVGAREPLTSLRTALAMVGEEQFRKMALTALTSELCGGQSMETLRFMLQKARFCELMAEELGLEPMELYVFGMLSVVRSTLDLSADDMAVTMKLRPEMATALTNERRPGEARHEGGPDGDGNAYGHLLQLFGTYDQGDWLGFSEASRVLGGKEESISGHCLSAQRWAAAVMAAA